MRSRFAFTLSLMLLFPSTIALIQSNPAFSLSGSPIAQSTASDSLQIGLEQLYTSQLRPAIASFQSAIAQSINQNDLDTDLNLVESLMKRVADLEPQLKKLAQLVAS